MFLQRSFVTRTNTCLYTSSSGTSISSAVKDDYGSNNIGYGRFSLDWSKCPSTRNSTGSITDLDGRYSVQASEGQTLVFSYIGFKSQTIKIGTSSIINVVLIEDNEMLDEVVVVGYGVQKKKLVTGATVQVKGDKIAELNTTNPLQAMQGQTPGVNITSISGQPGESLKVSIRGLGTIGNAEPLYLIDGVRGDISNLNPADIESIDILKDAASAAIYGAQAANGVVLVTTKNGKEGKAVVSFDGYFGVQNVAKEVNLLNTEQYMMIMDESHRNSTGSGYNWSGYKSIYDANGNLYDVDWLDKMFEDNAQMQSYTLGITGGSTVSQYAISLGYMSQEGIVGGKDVSNFSRYNFRINSEHKLFKNLLKVGEQVSFVYRDKTGVGVGGQYDNSLRGAYEIAPFVPIYSDNNIYDMPYNDTSNSDWNQESGNPYGLMMMRHNQNKNVFFSGNAYAELQPIKNLKFVLYSVLTTVPMNTATSTRYTNSVLQAVILIPVLPKICSMYWNLHGPIRLLMTGKLMTMPSMP